MSSIQTQDTTLETWTLDAAHTTVGFSAKHMMFTTVRGRFGEVSGSVGFDAERPASPQLEVEIGAASIDTGNDGRDQHLRSADFLDVERFPHVRFRARHLEGGDAFEEGAELRLVGDLTIKGVTREVTLDVRFDGRGVDPWGGERMGFTARTRIDRRDFGLTWNQALEAGGVLVSNEVRIEIEAQLAKA